MVWSFLAYWPLRLDNNSLGWSRRGQSFLGAGSAFDGPILLLVILQILAGADVPHPVGVLLIPAHRLAQSLLERHLRFPVQLTLRLGAVDGVAAVVAGPVLDIADQRGRLAQDGQ